MVSGRRNPSTHAEKQIDQARVVKVKVSLLPARGVTGVKPAGYVVPVRENAGSGVKQERSASGSDERNNRAKVWRTAFEGRKTEQKR